MLRSPSLRHNLRRIERDRFHFAGIQLDRSLLITPRNSGRMAVSTGISDHVVMFGAGTDIRYDGDGCAVCIDAQRPHGDTMHRHYAELLVRNEMAKAGICLSPSTPTSWARALILFHMVSFRILSSSLCPSKVRLK